MATQDFEPFPSSSPEENVSNLARPAQVIIVKRLLNALLPGARQPQTEHQKFRADYAEFLSGAAVIRSLPEWDQRWLVDLPITAWNSGAPIDNTSALADLLQPGWNFPAPTSDVQPLYKHYSIVADNNSGLMGKLLGTPTSAQNENTDILSIHVSLSVKSRATCSVTLNCREQKYLFTKNPFLMGRTIFEQNDIIQVYLPTRDGQLLRSFTGLITTVTVNTQLGGQFRNTITLQCEDSLKALTQNRCNLKPSGDSVESQGVTPNGLGNVQLDNVPPHQAITCILSRALCQPLSDPIVYTKLDESRRRASSSPIDTRAKEAGEQEKIISGLFSIQDKSNNGFIFYGPTVERATLKGVAPVAAGKWTSGTTIPSYVLGFKKAREKGTPPSKDNTLTNNLRLALSRQFAFSGVAEVADPEDLVFAVSAIDQPIFDIALSGAVDPFTSEWKSSLDLMQDIASRVNYEFFCNEDGVVLFRPMDLTMPDQSSYPIADRGVLAALTSVGNAALSLVGLRSSDPHTTPYWISPLFITQQSFSESDNEIFTLAYVTGGQAQWAGKAPPIRGSAVDVLKVGRFGIRQAPSIYKSNLISNEACSLYAHCYLAFLNSNMRTARITYSGDSQIRVGRVCYVENKNTLYYITGIDHSYTPGQGYTMQFALEYGRRPIAVQDGKFAAGKLSTVQDKGTIGLLRYNQLTQVLANLARIDAPLSFVGNNSTLNRNLPGTPSTSGNEIFMMSEYIRANTEELTFQSFVWEPLYLLNLTSLTKSCQFLNKMTTIATVGSDINAKAANIKRIKAWKMVQSGLEKKKIKTLKEQAAADSRFASDVVDASLCAYNFCRKLASTVTLIK